MSEREIIELEMAFLKKNQRMQAAIFIMSCLIITAAVAFVLMLLW
jgi:transposase